MNYYQSSDSLAPYEFGDALYSLLQKHSCLNKTIVFLCIGSDRATGDCLGPLLGYKLSRSLSNNYLVYGTLDSPVHAKNLKKAIDEIKETIKNPIIIAVDASLGQASHIGCFTLGNGPLKPGAGVNKDLPSVGDIFITGIVNISGLFDQMLLQNTRLNMVMTLADNIYSGTRYCMHRLNRCT